MARLTRVAMAVAVIPVAVALGAAPTANAESVTVSERGHGYPDLRSMTFDNAQRAVHVTLRFDEILRPTPNTTIQPWDTYTGTDVTVMWKGWGAGHYELRFFYQDYPRPRWFFGVARYDKDGWAGYVKCPAKSAQIDWDHAVVRLSVPRRCLKAAPDRLKARAYSDGYTDEQTPWTRKVKRG